MYDMKALYEAGSVDHAIWLLKEHPGAQIIAGGSDVLVQMREGKRSGAELVSIHGLDELRGVKMEKDGTLRIGSLTSFSHITKDPLIREYFHVLGEAVDMAGGPQIRNIATIGGNTCNGVTSADSASTLFAWDAVVELTTGMYESVDELSARRDDALTAQLGCPAYRVEYLAGEEDSRMQNVDVIALQADCALCFHVEVAADGYDALQQTVESWLSALSVAPATEAEGDAAA